jgi:glutathione S-transferase
MGPGIVTEACPQWQAHRPAYLAKNPMGKMPLLELDGVAIPESEVICEQ